MEAVAVVEVEPSNSFIRGGGGGGREEDTDPLLCRQHLLRVEQDESITWEIGGSARCYKTFDWRAPTIILGFVCLENLGFFGISTNMVIYLTSILHESNASVATSVTTWAGTGYFVPFLGAVVADSYLGNYWTIFFSSLLYLAGMATVTLSALLQSLKPPPCDGNSCPSATGAQKLFFFFGLYLIAFGSGGVKSSLLPLGAHQFDEENPAERVKQSSFFNWFYFCINVGALVSSTLIVWIQENVDWALGFAICALCIAAALGVFLIGTPTYRVRESRGSPMKRILQVLVASFRKANLNLPADSSCLYEVQGNNSHSRGDQRLERTRDLRFLDKAAILSDLDFKDGGTGNCSRWRLCTITQVEESKLLLRLFPIWVTGVVYSAGYSQMYTTFVEQGRSMDKKIGSFSIPPASLCAFEVLSVMFWVVLYNTVIRNIVLRYSRGGHGLSELQRIGIGYVLMILAIATAAVVEAKRLEGAHDDDNGKPISILWQLPQFFIVGGSEVFCCIAQLELFYDQGSDTMKSMSTAISLLAISLGNYLSSLIVTVVNLATTAGGRGWIPDDLDEGHLDYFFWLLVAVFVLNFVAYLACARRFTLRKTTK